MKPQTRSILQELNQFADKRSIDSLTESRAMNVIKSAINLLESIHLHYDEQDAIELERRLVNSIKGSDPAKFTRGIRKISESRKTKKILD